MKCALHGQTSCPLCDPLPRRREPREPHPSNVAIDTKGNVLPYTPEEVQQVQLRALDSGNLMCAIFELPNGDYAIQIFGPPSQKIVELLETTLESYKRALKVPDGHHN